MNKDIDDILCDAQDYYFEGRYEEAIEILEEGKKQEKDVGIYEMIIMCSLELKLYQKAYENAKEWKSIAKRDTYKKCLTSLLRTAYLSNQKETVKEVVKELIEIDENIEEALILFYDMIPEEHQWVIETVKRKKRQQPSNELLKEIERRLEKESIDEKEHILQVGDIIHCIGLMITISDIFKKNDENEKKKLADSLELINEKNSVIENTIKLLRNEQIASHGIHLVLRKYASQ